MFCIQILTVNLIETLKTSFFNTKHTKHTKLHCRKYFSKKSIFPKVRHPNELEVYVRFYGTTNILYILTIIVVLGHSPVSFYYVYIQNKYYLQPYKPRFRHRAGRCFWAGACYSRRIGVGAECDKARERTVFVQGGR